MANTHTDLISLLAELSYRKGTFTLASGRESDFYVDVKQTVFTAQGSALVGDAICKELADAGIDSVGGMAVGAVPLVSAALSRAGQNGLSIDGFFVRKDVKDHGTAKKLDGRFRPEAKIALVEDVVTTGQSTIDAIDAVEAAGGKVALVVTVVDRQEDDGMAKLAARAGGVCALATREQIVAAAG